MKINLRKLFLFFSAFVLISDPISAKETPHFEVVREFIQEISETQHLRDLAELDMAESSKSIGDEKIRRIMADVIRNGTRAKMKIKARVYALKQMKLNKPYENLTQYLIDFNEKKINLWDEMIVSAKLLNSSSQKNDYDYSKVSSRMPEITAEMEFIDESIFKITPLILILMIDQRPDSLNHLSRLIITKKQSQELVAILDGSFGEKLKEVKQNWNVSTASVIREFLLEKGYKYADDPIN